MHSPGGELRVLRMISAAMIGGLMMLLAVALLMRHSMNASASLNLVAYVAAGWALVSAPVADVMRSARFPTTTPEQDLEYWRKRSSAHIVSMGIVEGAALLCCVALMVTTSWLPLAALLVPLGAMIAWFPRA